MPISSILTIEKHATAELIEKKSRFIGEIIPVQSEQAARDHLQQIRALHHEARHHVYAWVIGANEQSIKSSDDGEPSGTGGRPVLEVIKKAGLGDIMIVVTRYFGGILLGSGGLSRAYGKTAQLSLAAAKIIFKIPAQKYALTIPYPHLSKIETYLCEENISTLGKTFGDQVCLICAIDSTIIQATTEALTNLTNGNIHIHDLNEQIYIIKS